MEMNEGGGNVVAVEDIPLPPPRTDPVDPLKSGANMGSGESGSSGGGSEAADHGGSGCGFGNSAGHERILKKASQFKPKKFSGLDESEVTGAFMDKLQITEREPVWTRGKGVWPPANAPPIKKARLYLVAQVQTRTFWLEGLQQDEEGVVVARVDDDLEQCWPELIWVPATLVEAPRRLEMGDSLRVAKLEWAATESGFAKEGAWIHAGAGVLNFQAVALEVNDVQQELLIDAIGLVSDTHRRFVKGRGWPLRTATVVSSLLACAMKIQKRHLPDEFDDRAIQDRTVLALQMLPVMRPQKVFLANGYVLPASFPERTGEELLVSQPFTIFAARPHEERFIFPFTGDLYMEQVRFGEAVLAAAVAAQVDLAKREQKQGVLVVEPLDLEARGERRLVMSFRWIVGTKKELVDLGEVWEVDTAVSCSVEPNEPAAKPCAQGYVTEAAPRALDYGFELFVRLTLGLNSKAKGVQVRQFQELQNGDWDRVELKPHLSVKAMSDCMDLLAGGVCSAMAEDVSRPAGCVMAMLLGRPVERVAPPQGDMNGLLGEGTLAKLQGPQCDTARLMLDETPRVVDMQAPPGTGKT